MAGLDRRMPAFGDALVRRAESSGSWNPSGAPSAQTPPWPRGELNLPRRFFTEKAFPENEVVLTTSF